MNKNSGSLEKRYKLILGAIIVAAAALRAAGLSRNVFFIDESFSYVLASQEIKGILRGAMSESNPPLPMLLFHFWQMFGKSEVYLRILPLVLNLLTIPVVFALARRLKGTGAGLAAAALFAAAAGMTDLSLIYRYPALLTMLSGLYVLLYFRAAEENTVFPAGALAIAAIVEIAGLYTHYFFIFPVIAVNAVALWDAAVSRRIPMKRYGFWIASQMVAAAAIIPWALAIRQQAAREMAWIPLAQSAAHLARSLFGAVPKVMVGYLIGPFTSLGPRTLIAAVGAAMLLAIIFFLIDPESRARRFRLSAVLIIILFTPYFMMIFVGLRLMPLYFCVAAAPFFALAGAAVCAARSKALRVSLLTALVVLSFTSSFMYHALSRIAFDDNKSAIKQIADGWREGDVVLINPTYQASLFEYFAPGRFKLFGIPGNFDILKYNFNDTEQVTEARLNELGGQVGACGRVWAFMGFGTKTKPDQKELTINYLRERYEFVSAVPFTPISFSAPVGRLFLFRQKSCE
ncbi:MAG: glycosyltransferase family 39 protein [bacterium]